MQNRERIVDIQPMFLDHTLHTSSEFLGLLDRRGLGSEATHAKGSDDFSIAVDAAEEGVMKRVLLGNFYRLYNTKRFRWACRTARMAVLAQVQRALTITRGASSEKLLDRPGGQNILEDMALQTQDPERLTSMSLDLLLAGRATTATMLSSLVYYLAKNQSVYERLCEEVQAHFGDANNANELTFERLKSCGYLQWCMHETLRLRPSVPLGIKVATCDTTLPRGGGADGSKPMFVAKGTEIIWSFYHMHRDPELWGEDAEEWKPERWQDTKMGTRYAPFNAGPRTCPGQQFALTSAGVAMVMICKAFEKLEDHNGTGGPRMSLGIVTLDLDGVKVRLYSRGNER
jgi:cytochrome P450